MKYIFLISLPFLCSCGVNLDLMHGLATMKNDNAIVIEVQSEALGPNSYIQIGLECGPCESSKPSS